MFDMGFLELMVIGVISLLVLGPERLPHAARKTGLFIGKMRRMMGQVTQEIDRQLKADEMREKLRKEGDHLGLEKIQGTVNEALAEARKFEQYVETPATGGEPVATPQKIAPTQSVKPSAAPSELSGPSESSKPGDGSANTIPSSTRATPDATSEGNRPLGHEKASPGE